MTIYEHVTISHDLVLCTQTSNNLNNAQQLHLCTMNTLQYT